MSLSGMAIKLIPSPSNKDYTHVYRVLAFVICCLAIAAMIISVSFSIPPADGKPSSSSRTHHGKASHGPSVSSANRGTGSSNSGNTKVVMINFDDGYKSQILYAKPI